MKGWLAGAVLAAVGLGRAGAQAATAVPALDFAKFSSSWYEIAHYPDKAEKHCVHDGLFLFADGERKGHEQEVTSCINAKGYADIHNHVLRLEDDKVKDGRLKVYLFPILFYRKQWVVALGDGYQWALMGNPNHKTLWVLSHTAEVTPEVMAEIKTRAVANGYDPTKLVMVPRAKQSGRTSEPQP